MPYLYLTFPPDPPLEPADELPALGEGERADRIEQMIT